MLKEYRGGWEVHYFCTGMKQNKNTVTLILMISSLVLLIVLQVFWLRSSYERSFHDLRRESSMLFRSTVLGLRDSLFMKNVMPVSGDTVGAVSFGMRTDRHDSIRTIGIRKEGVMGYFDFHEDSDKVQISIAASGHDTIPDHALRPFASKLQTMRLRGRGNKSFVVRLGDETLKLDTLTLLYRQALSTANIDAPVLIRNVVITPQAGHSFRSLMNDPDFFHEGERKRRLEVFSDSITCDPVRANPIHVYTASIGNVRGIIFREITAQVLFSIFLTLITSASFLFMFRNIRSQQRLMEAKNEFMSNVTHELKTPVATVSVALEALKSFQAIQNPKLAEEYLDIAQRELNRLSIMTDKILKASIFESKGVEFEPENIDLDATIREMMASMKMVFEKQHATVTYVKEGENFMLEGGAVHLTNVIYNLIDNALKYSREKPSIGIRLKDSGSLLILSVRDSGIGIAPEYHTRIFEKFFRVPSGDVHDTKGYGLGLSYVASVVKSHHGVIDIISRPGEGSEFKITLPRPPGRIHKIQFAAGRPKPTA
jgi:two-component system phosphate regulon sensor histidine kinase PhoR